jgi:hypothetical protein
LAEIIKHNEFSDTYDDPEHPIPSLTHIEVCAIRKGGGSNLAIVVAKPLLSDESSLTRLLDKIEGYLGHIHSDEHVADAGKPTPENTTISVHIHPDSSAEAFELLARSKAWVTSNGVTLEVVELTDV